MYLGCPPKRRSAVRLGRDSLTDTTREYRLIQHARKLPMAIFRMRRPQLWQRILLSTGRLSCRRYIEQNFNLLQPRDKLIDQRSEDFFRLSVIKRALFITLDCAVMPLYQELIRKHALIVQAFHESIEIFLLRLVSLHKVQYDRLEQTLDTNLAISLNQPQECSLILSPSLYDIALL